RAQQNPQAIRQSLNHRINVGHSVERMRNFGKDLGAPVFFAGGLRQASRFQQATELGRKNCRLRRQVIVEIAFNAFLKEHGSADDFIRNYQRSCHDGAGAILAGHGITQRIHMVDVNRALQTDGIGGYRTLVGLEAGATELVGHEAVSFGADQLLRGKTAPKVSSADLEELAAITTKELDKSAGVGALGGGVRDTQQQLLK